MGPYKGAEKCFLETRRGEVLKVWLNLTSTKCGRKFGEMYRQLLFMSALGFSGFRAQSDPAKCFYNGFICRSWRSADFFCKKKQKQQFLFSVFITKVVNIYHHHHHHKHRQCIKISKQFAKSLRQGFSNFRLHEPLLKFPNDSEPLNS